MSDMDKPWVRNACGLWCPSCGAHIRGPWNAGEDHPPDVCRTCGYPDFEDGYGDIIDEDPAISRHDGKCTRCNRHPADPALLGSDEEGHICGACWSEDQHADSSEAERANMVQP